MFISSLLQSSLFCAKHLILCKQLKLSSQVYSLSTTSMGDVPKETLEKLEAGFAKLQGAADCKSLLKKHLSKEIFEELKGTVFIVVSSINPILNLQEKRPKWEPLCWT